MSFELKSPEINTLDNSIGRLDNYDPDKRIEKSETNESFSTNKYDPDKRINPGFLDDNGKLFRNDTDLLPNNTFEKNGYEITTDEIGRTSSVEGTLRLKPEGKKRGNIGPSLQTIGKGYEHPEDERGHYIGDRFEGPGTLGNLFPQDASFNKGEYNKFENSLAEALKEGADVRMKIEPVYKGDSFRPDSVQVSYSINGEEFVRVFKNRSEQ